MKLFEVKENEFVVIENIYSIDFEHWEGYIFSLSSIPDEPEMWVIKINGNKCYKFLEKELALIKFQELARAIKNIKGK